MTKKRLFLYLGLTFGLTWGVFLLWILSGGIYLDEEGSLTPMASLIGGIAMLCPTIGMLLTRRLTKEGFAFSGTDSMLLGINLKNKKWILYLMVMILPWIYFELGNGLRLLLSPEAFSTEVAEEFGSLLFIQPFASIVNGIFVSFAALGEELGWRGYMMPKLLKLMDAKWAVLVGGIIWGIWHWPMIYMGHNFGFGYLGYPFTGFAAMCVMSVAIGTILTYVTCRTGSIWPAAILHAVNNASPGILQYYFDSSKVSGRKGDSVASSLIMLLPMIVISVVFYVLLCRQQAKNKTGFSSTYYS